VDLNSETDISGLYAIGETSFTGLHGANRMASNSLLECFVFGASAARHITQKLLEQDVEPNLVEVPRWDDSRVQNPDEDVVICTTGKNCVTSCGTMWVSYARQNV